MHFYLKLAICLKNLHVANAMGEALQPQNLKIKAAPQLLQQIYRKWSLYLPHLTTEFTYDL